MRDLPFKLSLYIAVLSLLAIGLSVGAVMQCFTSLNGLLAVAIFSLAIFVSDLYPIRLPTTDQAEVTVSCAFKTAAAIVYGPWVAIPAAMIGTFLAELAMKREWYKALFNAAEMTLTTAAMAAVYELLQTGSRMPFGSARNGLAVVAMMLTYAFTNTGLVAGVMAVARHMSLFHVWSSNFRDSIWNNLTIIPTGAVIAALWLLNPWSVLFLVLPVIVLRRSFEYIGELRNQTRATLVRMADAVDQRDPSTFMHSQRVAQYSAAIAQEIGLPIEAVDTIRMAGRLHDLGKIGMSNDLLYKPGAFDADELATFRQHAQIGADLLDQFQFFEDGKGLVLYHHEHYDGTGYLAGLAGEDIPLGSRILSVADAFDAMTSKRVYRSPLTFEQAISELERCSGTQFDPQIVEVFVGILRRPEWVEGVAQMSLAGGD